MQDSNIKKIIEDEVRAHQFNLNKHHVDTISEAIFNQLNEYMTIEQLDEIIGDLRIEFVSIVDSLIPIVEEYEGKIDDILNQHLAKLNFPKD